jgi:nucleotide-binding universal stress UspA family protein
MSRLFRRILVPHDFSPYATRALRAAAELAASEKGRILVLHAIAPVYPVAGLPPVGAAAGWLPPPIPSAELLAHERRRLEALVARALSRRRVRVDSRVVVAEPFQAIMAGARGATAIVMGTLGRTGLPHLVLGSVAEKVVRHSPVPVLTIRAGVRRARRAR